MKINLKKVFFIGLSAFIGTLAVLLIFLFENYRAGFMMDSGAEEVAQVAFYFFFMPLLGFIGLITQLVLSFVYDLWINNNNFKWTKPTILCLLLSMLSSWFFSEILSINKEEMTFIFIVFLLMSIVYFLFSQLAYYFLYIKKEINKIKTAPNKS
jgi:hypothetical protein